MGSHQSQYILELVCSRVPRSFNFSLRALLILKRLPYTFSTSLHYHLTKVLEETDIYLSVCLFIYLFICIFMYVFIYLSRISYCSLGQSGIHYVAQVGLVLVTILLPQHLYYWAYRFSHVKQKLVF